MTPITYLNSKPQRGYYDDSAKEFLVGFIPHKSGTYRIEIDDVLINVGQFSTAIQVLENAKEDDDVVIYLQTYGGSVNAGEALIHAMRKCAAPIHIVATGSVHSMGTCILLEADSIELSANFNACLHCGSDGAVGNANEYRIKSAFDAEFRTKEFKECYQGFLSDKEISDMLDGKDIWLDAEGWMKRALVRSEYFKTKFEKLMAEEEEAIVAELEALDAAPKAKRGRKKSPKSSVDTIPEL